MESHLYINKLIALFFIIFIDLANLYYNKKTLIMKRETHPNDINSKRNDFVRQIRKKQRAEFIAQKRSKLIKESNGKQNQKQQNLNGNNQLSYTEQKQCIIDGLNTIQNILNIFKIQSQSQISKSSNIFKAILSARESQIVYQIQGSQTIFKLSLPNFLQQLNLITKIDSDVIKEVNEYNSFNKKQIYLGNYQLISQNIFESLFKCIDVFQFCKNIIKELVKMENFKLQGNNLMLIQKITDMLIQLSYVQLQNTKTVQLDYTKIGQVQAFKQSKLGKMIQQFTIKVKQISKDIANQLFSVFKISVNLVITKSFSVQSIQKMSQYSTSIICLQNLIYSCGNLLSDIKLKNQYPQNSGQKLNNLTPQDVVQFLNSIEDLLNYQFLVLTSRKLFLSSIVEKRFKQVLKFCELQVWICRTISLSKWFNNLFDKSQPLISGIIKKNIQNSMTKMITYIRQNKNQIQSKTLSQLEQSILSNIQQFLIVYFLIQKEQAKSKEKSNHIQESFLQQEHLNNQSFSIILHKSLEYLKEFTKIKRQKRITILIENIYCHLIQISEIYFICEDSTRINGNVYQTVTSQISISILEFILDCVNGQILCTECLSLPILLFQYHKQKKVNIHKNSDLLDFIYLSFTQSLHNFNPVLQNPLQNNKNQTIENNKTVISAGVQDLKGQKISKYHTNVVKFLYECYDYYVSFRTKRLMQKKVQQGLKGKDMQDETLNQKKSLFQQLLSLKMSQETSQQLKNFVTIPFLKNYFAYISDQYDQNNLAFMKQAMKLFNKIIMQEQSLEQQIKDMFENNTEEIKFIVEQLTTNQDFDLSLLAVQVFENLELEY